MSAFQRVNVGVVILLLLIGVSLTIGFLTVFSNDATPISDVMYAKSRTEQSLSKGSPVVFQENTVFTGIAIAHTPDSSVFTMNSKGIYQITFTLSMGDMGKNNAEIALMINQTEYSVNKVWGDRTDSVTVLIEASVGDTVKLVTQTGEAVIESADLTMIKIK